MLEKVILFGQDLLPVYNVAMEWEDNLICTWLCHKREPPFCHRICLGRQCVIHPLGCHFWHQDLHRVEFDPCLTEMIMIWQWAEITKGWKVSYTPNVWCMLDYLLDRRIRPGNTKIIWSWHNFRFTFVCEDMERTIRVSGLMIGSDELTIHNGSWRLTQPWMVCPSLAPHKVCLHHKCLHWGQFYHDRHSRAVERTTCDCLGGEQLQANS